MANVFAIARHNAENSHIVVSRNGKAPFTMFRVSELDASDSGLSINAVQRWLDAQDIDAKAIEIERKPALQTTAFPYAVRVRAVRGLRGN